MHNCKIGKENGAVDTVSAYLEAVDAEAPGLVEGLYLVGSVALDDFRPGDSDLDYLAVTAERPRPAAVAALARAHRRLREARPRPYFDGAYVTWADLARDPATIPPGPGSHEGRFAAETGERGPVEWHTLARYGVAQRGPAPAELDVWTDADRLAAWTDGNLDAYWGRLLDRCARLPSLGGWWAAGRYAAVWVATGVTRLHYTLATGDITVEDRRRSRYPTPLARRRDLLAYGRMVVDDAHRRYARRTGA